MAVMENTTGLSILPDTAHSSVNLSTLTSHMPGHHHHHLLPFSQPFQLGLDAFFITETIVYVLLIYLNDSDYLDFKIEKCWDGNAQSFGFLRSITV